MPRKSFLASSFACFRPLLGGHRGRCSRFGVCLNRSRRTDDQGSLDQLPAEAFGWATIVDIHIHVVIEGRRSRGPSCTLGVPVRLLRFNGYLLRIAKAPADRTLSDLV
uniref:Putative secreted protein n=1 Tax=Anopheles darlingi TaxID=43151 RepID=A0A2M4D9B9_ANODA